MNPVQKISRNEEGYAMVVALMIMAILSLIGVYGINTSIMEQQIAGNVWNANRTFYRTDGGISQGLALIQSYPKEIDLTGIADDIYAGDDIKKDFFSLNPPITDSEIIVKVALCREQSIEALKDPTHTIDCDSDATYFWDPDNILPGIDVGFLYIGSEKQDLPGEDIGKKQTLYDVYSQFIGPKRSEAIILQKWTEIDVF